MSNNTTTKETEARKLIDILRSNPGEMIKIAALSYALGLEAGAIMPTGGDSPAA